MAVFLISCGKETPSVTLEVLDGNVLQQKDWQGKWVYINYWAAWCKPCTEEVPELNKFAAATPNALVLGINFDKPASADLLVQANRFRIEYPVIVSDIQLAFPHTVPQSLPATIVINPDGKLVDTLQGPQTVATLAQAMK
ncbi:MAG TPA: TlpA disulfide reductase family protein [Pseudomonadales bacterium]|nr:TlpA disulfide reductase family protein [Pseudomonadales bacterium]